VKFGNGEANIQHLQAKWKWEFSRTPAYDDYASALTLTCFGFLTHLSPAEDLRLAQMQVSASKKLRVVCDPRRYGGCLEKTKHVRSNPDAFPAHKD